MVPVMMMGMRTSGLMAHWREAMSMFCLFLLALLSPLDVLDAAVVLMRCAGG